MKTLHLKAVPSNQEPQCEWSIRADGSHSKAQARPAPGFYVPRLAPLLFVVAKPQQTGCGWTIAPDGEFVELARVRS